VTPLLVAGIMDRRSGGADRAWEAGAGLEIDPDIQAAAWLVELDIGDFPRRG
jgi:hypothetical protein